MITINDAIDAISRAANNVQFHAQYLNDLDAIVGDGEHGINLARAFKRVQDKLPNISRDNFGILLKSVGLEMIAAGGGAGTTFYGTAFLAAGKVAGLAIEIDAALFGEMFSAAVEDISKRGGALRGDKTMIDALEPAFENFQKGIEIGNDINEVLRSAVVGAREGALSTKQLLGKKGRSLYSSQRGLGTPDPGATSAYLILCGIAGIETEIPL